MNVYLLNDCSGTKKEGNGRTNRRQKLPKFFRFIYTSLTNGAPFIEWIDESTGKFKITDSNAFAQTWAVRPGVREGKPRDQGKPPKYESLGRLLR